MPQSIFSFLGYEVVTVDSGVYHLRQIRPQQQPLNFVAMLFSEEPGGPVTALKLFVSQLELDTPIDRVIAHWKTLDARRMEESGIDTVDFDIGAEYMPTDPEPVIFNRPNGNLRHGFVLRTGEIVCYN